MQIITLKIFVPMPFILTHFVPRQFSTDSFCTVNMPQKVLLRGSILTHFVPHTLYI